VLGEYLAAKRLDLTVEVEREPRPLQTEVQTSDAGEE